MLVLATYYNTIILANLAHIDNFDMTDIYYINNIIM